MNLDGSIELFIAICAGIGALKVIISSVKNCIKQEMKAVVIRLDHLEKDSELLAGIEKKVLSKADLQDMIDKAILQHQKEDHKK